jgi:hypothetical protein
MLELCPQCNKLTVEYDINTHVKRCLNRECCWVGHETKTSSSVQGKGIPHYQFSREMERRILKRNQATA